MKKALILILVFISLVVLLLRFGEKGAAVLLNIKQTSGINVLSTPEGATVYLDSKEVGKTPFEDKNLEAKEYILKIAKDQLVWQGKVKLVVSRMTVVNRELSKDSSSQAGEVLNLEKGSGITVISNPPQADVEVDGKSYDKTPISLKLDSGEHTLALSHVNYLKRSIRVLLPDDNKLVVSVDLALSEADLSQVPTPVITQTKEVVVKETPTGFLRVRDEPSLSGKEVTKVKPGDKLVLLEEFPSWYRVRLSDNTEGYVSSSYVEKIKPVQ